MRKRRIIIINKAMLMLEISVPCRGMSSHRLGKLLAVDPPIGTNTRHLQQLVHWTEKREEVR